jgi:hypothetical protein
MRLSASCRRGLIYGGVCAGFGAVAWTFGILWSGDFSDIPAGACVGFVFWGLIGFVVGRYDHPPGRSSSNPNIRKIQGSILGKIGRFFYRTLVGALAGLLVGCLVEAALVGLAIVSYGDIEVALKAVHTSQVALMFECGLMAAMVAAPLSGILFAWIWRVDEFMTAVWGSACGALGGSIGGIIPPLFTTDIWAIYGALLGGGFGGVLASVMAGFLLLRKQRTSLPETLTSSDSIGEYP